MFEETPKKATGRDLLIVLGILIFIGLMYGHTLVGSLLIILEVAGVCVVIAGLFIGLMILFNR